MASDKNHRPCLPLKPQEKFYIFLQEKERGYKKIIYEKPYKTK